MAVLGVFLAVLGFLVIPANSKTDANEVALTKTDVEVDCGENEENPVCEVRWSLTAKNSDNADSDTKAWVTDFTSSEVYDVEMTTTSVNILIKTEETEVENEANQTQESVEGEETPENQGKVEVPVISEDEGKSEFGQSFVKRIYDFGNIQPGEIKTAEFVGKVNRVNLQTPGIVVGSASYLSFGETAETLDFSALGELPEFDENAGIHSGEWDFGETFDSDRSGVFIQVPAVEEGLEISDLEPMESQGSANSDESDLKLIHYMEDEPSTIKSGIGRNDVLVRAIFENNGNETLVLQKLEGETTSGSKAIFRNIDEEADRITGGNIASYFNFGCYVSKSLNSKLPYDSDHKGLSDYITLKDVKNEDSENTTLDFTKPKPVYLEKYNLLVCNFVIPGGVNEKTGAHESTVKATAISKDGGKLMTASGSRQIGVRYPKIEVEKFVAHGLHVLERTTGKMVVNPNEKVNIGFSIANTGKGRLRVTHIKDTTIIGPRMTGLVCYRDTVPIAPIYDPSGYKEPDKIPGGTDAGDYKGGKEKVGKEKKDGGDPNKDVEVFGFANEGKGGSFPGGEVFIGPGDGIVCMSTIRDGLTEKDWIHKNRIEVTVESVESGYQTTSSSTMTVSTKPVPDPKQVEVELPILGDRSYLVLAGVLTVATIGVGISVNQGIRTVRKVAKK